MYSNSLIFTKNASVIKSLKLPHTSLEIFNFNDIKEEIETLYSNDSCNSNIIFDGELYTKSLNFETMVFRPSIRSTGEDSTIIAVVSINTVLFEISEK